MLTKVGKNGSQSGDDKVKSDQVVENFRKHQNQHPKDEGNQALEGASVGKNVG